MLIRERMARAMFAVGAMKMSSRKAWDTCEQAYRDFFMKIYYKEKYGKEYPDSLKDIVGKGKIVTPAPAHPLYFSALGDPGRDCCYGNETAKDHT